jgi:hypothetical protein
MPASNTTTVNASIEINGGKRRHPEADQTQPGAFSWSRVMNLPILKQTRFRSNCELNEPWMDTNLEGKIIRSHFLFL